MPRELLVQSQDGGTRTLPMQDKRRVTLGRAADNDLAYPDDPVLSRRHLAVEFDGDQWWAEDLGSKNGTSVNGNRISGRRKIGIGDRVTAGRVTLTLRDPVQETDHTVVFVAEVPGIETHGTQVSTNLEQVVGAGGGGGNDLEAALRTAPVVGTTRVQALLEAGRELAGHRPLPDLFKVILDLSVNSVGARRGIVMTLEGNELVPRAKRGENFLISRAVRDKILQSKDSLLILDTSQEEAFRSSMTIVQQRVKSFIAVPLQTKDKVIGLIYVDSPDIVRPFTKEDLTLLTVMANIAAVRIENARLVEVEQAERVMAKELEQAAEIQRNLLPKVSPPVLGLDVAGRSVACRSVGGDYFDYLTLPDNKLGILVGDVAGKGMSAALLMSSVQARAQVLAEENDDLGTFLTRLNRSVAINCPGNRFITLFGCTINPATGEFWYGNAGHNPPYLLRANGTVENLPAGGPVMGILKQVTYPAVKMQLGRGDVVVMFSDGVTEARALNDEEYGEDRLLMELQALRGQSAEHIVQAIFDSVERFMGDAPAGDDITLVVVRMS
ncbi:MAG: SpoIIE family protein phosphatase [Bryobacterales bacterium]|nr:SpoIIE family protein phosphatase [Bryobacterales bacterium]